jgi:predicted phosphodiesterase
MRIVCISDTHTMGREVQIPDGDILIHCGDWGLRGSMKEFLREKEWFENLPHKWKLGIAGNHDFCLENDKFISDSDKFIYLQDSGIHIEGLWFWGSPWQPEFKNWAFNLPRGNMLARKWVLIPNNIDVLITHCPPQGILDQVENGFEAGCLDLWNRIQELDLKLHIFGHIHEGYGQVPAGRLVRGDKPIDMKTTFINCSICTVDYQPTNKPQVIDL